MAIDSIPLDDFFDCLVSQNVKYDLLRRLMSRVEGRNGELSAQAPVGQRNS